MTPDRTPLLVPEFDPLGDQGLQTLAAKRAYIGRLVWLPKGAVARTCHRYRNGYLLMRIRKLRSVIIDDVGFDKLGLRLYWHEHGRSHYIDSHFVLLEAAMEPLQMGSRLRPSLLTS